MASVSLAQFLYGIQLHESGGNYRAISPDGALGHWQIMPDNVVAWGQQLWGRTVTTQQFLDSPQMQDELGVWKLTDLFMKYGPEGAASAWLTGDPNRWKTNPGSGDRNASVTNYINAVMAAAQGYHGDGSDYLANHKPVESFSMPTSGTYNTATASSTSDQSTPLSQNDFISAAGLAQELINSVPELAALVKAAQGAGWSDQEFAQHLHLSNWWKTNSSTARQYLGEKSADPASYNQDVARKRADILNRARQLGVAIGPGNLQNLTVRALYEGWSDTEINNALGAFWKAGANGPNEGGFAAQTMGDVRSAAAEQGIPISDYWVNKWTGDILSGRSTLDQMKESVKNNAMAAFPALTEQIKSGLTVKQIADPYVQTYANLLEVSPDSVKWSTDPMIKRALQGQPTEAGQPPVSTPLWQFESSVKNDPRWGFTKNARQDADSMLLHLGRDWGFSS